jgi:hypothetical protein
MRYSRRQFLVILLLVAVATGAVFGIGSGECDDPLACEPQWTEPRRLPIVVEPEGKPVTFLSVVGPAYYWIEEDGEWTANAEIAVSSKAPKSDFPFTMPIEIQQQTYYALANLDLVGYEVLPRGESGKQRLELGTGMVPPGPRDDGSEPGPIRLEFGASETLAAANERYETATQKVLPPSERPQEPELFFLWPNELLPDGAAVPDEWIGIGETLGNDARSYYLVPLEWVEKTGLGTYNGAVLILDYWPESDLMIYCLYP